MLYDTTKPPHGAGGLTAGICRIIGLVLVLGMLFTKCVG
jgi:hypothetical protein